MTARAFLARGLLAGLLAGIATFCVGYTVAEPQIQAAINVEESHAETATADPSAAADHHHKEDGTVVSRHNQRTWGLLTGSLVLGLAFGGIVALVAAGAVGRIGALSAGQSTALVALLGWLSMSLVPFLKYPANPPAVGNAETIGARTTDFFAFLLVSVVMAVVAVVVAQRQWSRVGTYPAVLAGVGVYLVVVVVAGLVLPTVNEVGDFPADTLWYFRRASLFSSATLWATIGVVLTGLVRPLAARTAAVSARRELASSL
jgi:putative cobalt transporter subunit CbtA